LHFVKGIYLCKMKKQAAFYYILVFTILFSCKPGVDKHLEEAKKALDTQKFKLAEQKSSEAIKIDPNNASALNLRGIAFLNQNELQNAIADFEHSIAVDSTNYKAFYNLGLAYIQNRNFDLAIKAFKNAIELNNSESDLYNNIGIAYYELNQQDSAIVNFSKAINLNPNSELAYINRAKIYRASSNWQAAIEDYNQGIKINPNNVHSVFGLALSYFEVNKKDEGCKWLKKAKMSGHPEAEKELKARCQ